MDSSLLLPFVRKKSLEAVDRGDADAFVQLYSFFAAQFYLGKNSEFDVLELKNHEKHLARRARIAFFCPSAFPTDSESEKIRKVAACILDNVIVPSIEDLDALLLLMERKEISVNARLAMAECLKKFLPAHHDIFTLDSLPKRITVAMIGETGQTFRALDYLLLAVKKRYAKAQEESEPE